MIHGQITAGKNAFAIDQKHSGRVVLIHLGDVGNAQNFHLVAAATVVTPPPICTKRDGLVSLENAHGHTVFHGCEMLTNKSLITDISTLRTPSRNNFFSPGFGTKKIMRTLLMWTLKYRGIV
jgi:hypothetical protein